MDINIYCDESCHLERDGHKSMLLGALSCERGAVREVSQSIRALKAAHGLKSAADDRSRGFEIKWAKVSPARLDFYEGLIRFFLEDVRLSFRTLIVPDKRTLNHKAFDQTHDDFYYKCYYNLLLRLIDEPSNTYDIYLDIKDTRGGPKTRKLHEFLCKKLGDGDCTAIRRVEQIRSDESELLQLCDLLLGAVSYYVRAGNESVAKLQLVETLATHGAASPRDLGRTSFLSERKVNLFYWSAAPNQQ